MNDSGAVLVPIEVRTVDGFGAGAVFSADRRFRFRYFREWPAGDGVCVFVMLNPSTADESIEDPTVRRCRGFAQSWGCSRLEVVNLFALRSTDPRALYDALGAGVDPVGVGNDLAIYAAAVGARFVVAAWGRHGAIDSRGWYVRRALEARGVRLVCLGVNQGGSPRHPLYVRADCAPVPFSGD